MQPNDWLGRPTITNPLDGAVGVPATRPITWTFSEAPETPAGFRALFSGDVNAILPGPINVACLDEVLADGIWHPDCLSPGIWTAVIDNEFETLRDVSEGLNRLRSDLESGAWREKYGDLLGLTTVDLGYRILSSPGS